MKAFIDPVESLNDQQVKNHFLGILASNLSNEKKYQEFIEFFKHECQLREKTSDCADQLIERSEDEINKIFFQIGQDLKIWDTEQILQQTEDSIKRALGRLKVSQHHDGGWGSSPEQSHFWGTSYAVLCLHSATEAGITIDFLDQMLRKGTSWLCDKINLIGMDPAYEISLGVKCFYQIGPQYFQESTPNFMEWEKRLIETQNQDGGWNARLEGYRDYSEVGATSFVLQALAETRDQTLKDKIERGITWLIRTQNSDGSWNSESCQPYKNEFELEGIPVINKTCDALQGILKGKDFDLDVENKYTHNLYKAVAWLRYREQPLFDEKNKIKGWGWGNSIFDYENTCLTLETLVKMPDRLLV